MGNKVTLEQLLGLVYDLYQEGVKSKDLTPQMQQVLIRTRNTLKKLDIKV